MPGCGRKVLSTHQERLVLPKGQHCPGSSMQAPGRRKPVKSCQVGAAKAGEDGLERSWLEEAVAKSIFKPYLTLQLCRACTGKSSNCDMQGAASVTPAHAQGKVFGFQRCCSQDTSGQYILKMCQICLKYSCVLPVIYRNNHSSIIISMLLPVKNLICWR